MDDCTTCHWLNTFKPRPDEPSGNGCKNPKDGGIYVRDVRVPPCAYGGIKALSYSPRP